MPAAWKDRWNLVVDVVAAVSALAALAAVLCSLLLSAAAAGVVAEFAQLPVELAVVEFELVAAVVETAVAHLQRFAVRLLPSYSESVLGLPGLAELDPLMS